MEVTQFTYFQQGAASTANPPPAKSPTAWAPGRTCRAWTTSTTCSGPIPQVRRRVPQNEVEQSTHNFEHSDADFLFTAFNAHEKQAKYLMEQATGCRVRASAQGRAQLQPAGRPRRHQRDRARCLHRPHPQPGPQPWRKATTRAANAWASHGAWVEQMPHGAARVGGADAHGQGSLERTERTT